MGNRLLQTLVIAFLALLAKQIVDWSLRQLLRKISGRDNDPTNDETEEAFDSRITTIMGAVGNLSAILIYGMAFISILSEWGIDTTPILTGAGVVGLAVGIGSQSIVRDTMNGFFIILENQYNVGDEIEVIGMKGKVIHLNLRKTILKTDDGKTHTIPNSKIEVITKKA